MATGVENIDNCFTSNGITAPDGKQANTVGQANWSIAFCYWTWKHQQAQIFGSLPANNADYTSFGVSPIKDFL